MESDVERRRVLIDFNQFIVGGPNSGFFNFLYMCLDVSPLEFLQARCDVSQVSSMFLSFVNI